MIGYVLTGAACALLGLATGQTLVLSLGRRRLASQLTSVVERQTNLYNRVHTLEAEGAHSEEQQEDLTRRLHALEAALPNLISRAEVERAFAQAAQLEAQRQVAAQQQARAASLFGAAAAAPKAAPVELNTAINQQMAAMEERLNRINQEFGLG